MKILLIALSLVVTLAALGAATAIDTAGFAVVLFGLAVVVGVVLNTVCDDHALAPLHS